MRVFSELFPICLSKRISHLCKSLASFGEIIPAEASQLCGIAKGRLLQMLEDVSSYGIVGQCPVATSEIVNT